jgi:DNA-binding transcriptional ArsR family regulator
VSLLPSKPDITNDSGPRVVGIEGDDADELLSVLSSETAREIVAALHDDPAPPSELADRVDSSLQNVQYHLSRLDDAGVVKVAGTAYSEKGREMDVYAPANDPLVIVAAEDEQTSGLRAMLSRLLGGVGALLLGSAAVQQLFGDGILPGPFGGMGAGGSGAAPESANESDGGAVATSTPTEAATETPTRTATETVAPTATETPAGTPTPAATTTPTPQATSTETAAPTSTPAAETMDTVTESAASGGTDLVGVLPPGVLFFLGGLVVLVVAALSYGKRSV